MTFSNPYIAGNPVHEKEKFFGREDVLSDVLRALQKPETNAIVLFGQRRIGKTSVLLRIQKALRARDAYTPVYFDLQNKASLPLAEVLYQMAQQISLITKIPLPKREQFDLNGQFFHEHFIPTVIKSLGNQELILLLDEFDVLDLPHHKQAGTMFFPYLQQWMKKVKQVQFVFVLGRRPEELSTDTLAAFKELPSRKVALMTNKNCEIIIRQSETRGGLAWSNAAVDRVWHWTQGHPYFTQLVCSEIWEAAHPPNGWGRHVSVPPHRNCSVVLPNMVDSALDRALEQGANAFQWIWNGLPPAERVIMAAMAEADDEPMNLESLAHILHRSRVRLILRELEIAPETLIRWDLLCPTDDGRFRFAVPLLRRWVASEKPLRRVKAELDSLEPLAESLYRSGEGFYKMGNLVEANRLLRNALNVNPNHFRARLLLGQVLLGQGAPVDAVEILEQAYQFDPRSAQPGLIGALLALSDIQSGKELLATYNRILEIEPAQVTVLKKKRSLLLNIAKSAAQKGNFNAALKLYQRLNDQEGITSVMLGKQKLAKQLAIARRHEGAEDWFAAIKIYQTLLHEFPERTDWQARLKIATQQKELAETYLQACNELQQGKRKKAQQLFGRIIGVQPDYKDALQHLLLAVKGMDLEKILEENRLAKEHQQVEFLGAGVYLEMVFISAGIFLMGSPEDEEGRFGREGPQHEVSIAPFFMGKYPITQEQWERIMDDNPSNFPGAKRPVDNISWQDALSFCERLSEKTGHSYRLPSETEWEYACRARTTTPFHIGKTLTFELANYDATQAYGSEPAAGQYRGETTDVGSFLPNGFGLHDMHGNVWEWCADPWHNDYRGAPSDGRIWEAGGNNLRRVLRGGAWDILATGCRSAFRDCDHPNNHEASYGLRVVLSMW